MKPVGSGLLALLAGNTFFRADLWKFVLADGTVINISGGDTAIGSYVKNGVLIGREGTSGKISQSIGTQVGTLDFELFADPNDATATLDGQPALTFIRQGGLDGATVQLFAAFMPTYGDISLGLVPIFTGGISDLTVGRSSAQITAKDPRELLNMQLPRNLYQTNCVRALYDAGCTLNKADFTTTYTVVGGSSANQIGFISGAPDGYYDLGTISFVTGVNAGLSRTIKAYSSFGGGTLSLNYPLPSAPTAGDIVNVAPGCARTQDACLNKFNNLINFAGTPYVPVAETAQ